MNSATQIDTNRLYCYIMHLQCKQIVQQAFYKACIVPTFTLTSKMVMYVYFSSSNLFQCVEEIRIGDKRNEAVVYVQTTLGTVPSPEHLEIQDGMLAIKRHIISLLYLLAI